MTKRTLFSVVESPEHPNFSNLYGRFGLEEIRLQSQRKAIGALRQQKPDYVVAEFIYSFHTYYQATNISNLDVLLSSLVKYSPETKVIIFVRKADRGRVEPLNQIHPLHAVLVYPVSEEQMEKVLLDGE